MNKFEANQKFLSSLRKKRDQLGIGDSMTLAESNPEYISFRKQAYEEWVRDRGEEAGTTRA